MRAAPSSHASIGRAMDDRSFTYCGIIVTSSHVSRSYPTEKLKRCREEKREIESRAKEGAENSFNVGYICKLHERRKREIRPRRVEPREYPSVVFTWNLCLFLVLEAESNPSLSVVGVSPYSSKKIIPLLDFQQSCGRPSP